MPAMAQGPRPNSKKVKAAVKKNNVQLVDKLPGVSYAARNSIVNNNYAGNQLLCFKPDETSNYDYRKMKRYCKANFDINGIKFCMDPMNFCHVCCGNEAGYLGSEEKDRCFFSRCG